jgi:hypothetical protein
MAEEKNSMAEEKLPEYSPTPINNLYPHKIPPAKIRRSHKQMMRPAGSIVFLKASKKNIAKQKLVFAERVSMHSKILKEYYFRDWNSILCDEDNLRKAITTAVSLLESHPSLRISEMPPMTVGNFPRIRELLVEKIREVFPMEYERVISQYQEYNEFTEKLLDLFNFLASHFAATSATSFRDPTQEEAERVCSYKFFAFQLAKYGPELFCTMDSECYDNIKSLLTEDIREVTARVKKIRQVLLEAINIARVHGRRLEVLSGGSLGRHWYCCRACLKVQAVRAEDPNVRI